MEDNIIGKHGKHENKFTIFFSAGGSQIDSSHLDSIRGKVQRINKLLKTCT